MKWYKSYIVLSLFFGLFLFSVSSCNESSDLVDRNWQLTWEDNFDGPAGQAPSAANWAYDLGTGTDGWGNFELQSYTDKPENVSLDGEGNLAITAIKEGGYTSARVKTQGKFEQKYGRFEARIQLPYGRGVWPAFWMLGSNIESVGWPQCGEIDIMELYGHEPSVVHGSLHGPGYFDSNPVTKTFGLVNDRFDSDFHVFAVEWDENSINYYVDDALYQQIEPEDASGEWVFDNPFFILLNIAVGGNAAGFPPEDGPFPQTMLVDYVKVYQEVE
jgi:beta-glucanase (GH16 family)